MANSETSVPAARSSDERLRRQSMLRGMLSRPELGAIAGTVLVFIFFAITARGTGMFAADGVMNWVTVTGQLTIIATGAALLMIGGEFDLSSGPTYGFCAVITGVAIAKWGLDPWAAVALALALGVLVGAINGLVTVGFGVPSFISTLGMSSVVGGLAIVLTGGLPITLPDDFSDSLLSVLAGGQAAGIPAQVLWAIAMFIVLQLMSPEFYAGDLHIDATKIILGIAGGWMLLGNLIMYKMINFKI